MAGSGASDCDCDPRNCTIPTSTDCTDPVCVCKAGTRTLRPFAEFLNSLGLRLGERHSMIVDWFFVAFCVPSLSWQISVFHIENPPKQAFLNQENVDEKRREN
jgi:hypothetical protein